MNNTSIMQFTKSGSSVTSDASIFLHSDWQLASAEAGSIADPVALENNKLDWVPAVVPGTVAQSLQEAGKWTINCAEDFDAKDWWYQCKFDSDVGANPIQKILRFAGLATIAEVWLNGVCILNVDNMFLEHAVDVTKFLKSSNDLLICFRSLNTALSARRPRPRWKTKLVNQQQLRWIRTTLLGRIPGWSPPIAPVGPWRDITLTNCSPVHISDVLLCSSTDGSDGLIDFSCLLQSSGVLESISTTLSACGHMASLRVENLESGYFLKGQLRIANPEHWWPHTHGAATMHHCALDIKSGDQAISVDCGKVGFRTITVNQNDGAFEISVNGEKVFCRGACWTVNDIVSINGTQQELEGCLELAKNAGMNMIRVGGTMVYESELFYSLCDKLGIMVWQDFMFANMDYPIEDKQFESSVKNEVIQQLQRWQSHPSIAVYCGNSEVEQQAAMLGMPKELWRSTLFSSLIPELCRQWHPDIPYVPSSPSGGTMPFHVGTGVTHYYGVGAYMQPISGVRRANVRFTPECLGFSNVPEPETVNALFEGQLPATHHPLWKSRVPRDTGTGWDFEDIRDHYLETLFQKDPVKLRCFDMERYLVLGRVTTGEMMAQVYGEWRSTYNKCGGALVWFFKDLWPGAGWGIVDSFGIPKACYYYLKRAWQSRQVLITDEALDGIHVHVINEFDNPFTCKVELLLLKDGNVVVARAERICEVAARTSETWNSDKLLGGFYDVSYAYRFGPPKHDVVVAILSDDKGVVISSAFHFPGERQVDICNNNINLIAVATEDEEGNYRLSLETDTLLQAVHFDVKDYSPDDNYFHLIPGIKKVILFRKDESHAKKFKAYVEALNLREPLKITVVQ